MTLVTINEVQIKSSRKRERGGRTEGNRERGIGKDREIDRKRERGRGKGGLGGERKKRGMEGENHNNNSERVEMGEE